ncbi:hypothetical protein HN51_005122 [Arachis hypogaea]|uniref:Copper transport protein n=2 Tax=Arachis hypogaea TaxID=3818 RepID=A0A445DG30_ARAHY|nr:copper transporter 1 [Arachis hypogaea]QHO38822.1 Copper transporter [Arachis hypogaea]RYR62120.1 hypothetical protein Ahy_A04g019477 [Arachis hypogaea]
MSLPNQETMQDMPNMTDNNSSSNMEMNMQMSFYWGKHGTVLFSGWPKSGGMYTLALFFVFFLSMAIEILSNQPPIRRGARPASGVTAQAVVYFFRISFVYLVMLAVMSFNGGIFIAAILGHSLGFFLAKFRAVAMANREPSDLEQKV